MKYPIGIQNFEKLIKDGFMYIDKTGLMYQLASNGGYYFLSRPRRFGKSLLISTLEAYFNGQKELFKGLEVETLEKEWTRHPVLHLDLNIGNYKEHGSLESILDFNLKQWEGIYHLNDETDNLSLRFACVIQAAYNQTGQQVVILIDEYDKPLLHNIGQEKRLNELRASLRSFYSVLKTQDRYIRFALLTGVTKFSKVSVFSDLNNLNDISMDASYTAICGITEEEIHQNLDEEIAIMAQKRGISKKDCYEELKKRYDGYHFHEDTPGIYNPFSLISALSKRDFKDYWFETGTPTFLVELLKKTGYRLDNLTKEQVTADLLSSLDSLDSNPIPMLYQSGYLTIKGYNPRFRTYALSFPNEEVEQGFIRYLMPYYAPNNQANRTEHYVFNFVNDVEEGRVEDSQNLQNRHQFLQRYAPN
ncbi:MAG: AAA family ATPase [Bacteroidaceae bacterium]|nr:AAA family ATPase [Bacteroidaceae bacterium]